MAAAALPLMLAGTAMSIGGTIASGYKQAAALRAQKQESDYQANLLQQQAGQARATAQRQAIGERRQAAYVMSRARAQAAASGGGATDPTVLNIEAGIGAQGEYNALSDLYGGEERARGMEDQSSLLKYQGQQYGAAAGSAIAGGYFSALSQGINSAGSILSSGAGSTLFDKYGAGGVSTKVAEYQ